MKFSSMFAVAAIAMASVVVADSTTPVVIPPTEALQAIKEANLPTGVKLTGVVETLKEPTEANAVDDTNQANKESFHHGHHGHHGRGGWGRWGGWGGYGPYRFGYSCDGLSGWAYPLGYWNAWGAGLYGGECGLGLGWGGLYYC